MRVIMPIACLFNTVGLGYSESLFTYLCNYQVYNCLFRINKKKENLDVREQICVTIFILSLIQRGSYDTTTFH